MSLKKFLLTLAFALINVVPANMQTNMQKNQRPRAGDVGVRVGVLPTGAQNAITDVAGVRVGHTTITRGESIRTGTTAILPHAGNLFREKVAGAVFVGNGFGKLAGSTQVNELGEIETPILLTSTLSVPRVADAVLDYMLALPGNEDVRSVNPLVAETNDGGLNDIRGRYITREDVFNAIKAATGGAVEEGAVGAGTGTIAFGFKGGIGTSSRKLPPALGGYTVGALVQTNYGGVLTINGAPVGRELGKFYLKDELERAAGASTSTRATADGQTISRNLQDSADGSIIIVIATDAPVDARNLRRMAARDARTRAHGRRGDERKRRLRHRVLHRARSSHPHEYKRQAERPARAARVEIVVERCDVAALPRRHRGDGRGYLQFALSRADDDRARQSDRRSAPARTHARHPAQIQRALKTTALNSRRRHARTR